MSEVENKPAMGETTRKGLEILQVAFVLGILGDSLFRSTPWGLNVFLWVTALTVGLWVVVTRHRESGMSIGSMSLHGALIALSAMFVWRDSTQLMVADGFAILIILSLLTLPSLKLKIQNSGLMHYALGWLYAWFNAALSPLFIIMSDIKWGTISGGKGAKYTVAVLRGVLVAAPLLLVFGALFVAADAAFESLITKTLHIDIEEIVGGHIFWILFLTWIVAGYLRGATYFVLDNFEAQKPGDTTIFARDLDLKDEAAKPGETAAPQKSFDLQDINNSFLPNFFTLGAVEVGVVLGLMNLLFLAFVVVQVPYLFGGMELVQNTEGFKLAEYARRGFGELVAVSALVLPTLMFGHWLIRREDKTALSIFKILTCVQIGLLFVIMVSAAQRMLLYTGTSGYGLTTLRFYPMVFILWMAGIFVWFAVTVIRGRREQFAWGVLWSALAVLGVMHVFNPDYFIARTNIQLMHAGRNFDVKYMRDLSDDAVPAIIEAVPSLSQDQVCFLQHNLNDRIAEHNAQQDLRSWNWSRWNARHQLAAAEGSFNLFSCPEEKYRDTEHDLFD